MSPQTITYPKRLIEVDLPIKKISEHARREKSIRHGHISTLHIWWARRPLAACRAVICASLWPDPADPLCPKEFIETARKVMDRFWNRQQVEKRDLQDLLKLRKALLDFIADFANWDNSIKSEYLCIARKLTHIAHGAITGETGTKPLIVDPFAGGGAIPLESLRVGADIFASDLNPIPVLLNKVILEDIPKFGLELANEVRKCALWINNEAEKELNEFYPKDADGAKPIAYLWARTIVCEGPGCGVEVPLIRSLWIAKKTNRSVGIRLTPNNDKNRVEIEIINNAKSTEIKSGTVKRGSATCPCCGYTTPVSSVRKQLKLRRGGTDDARMFCVVTKKDSESGRFYRLPTQNDLIVVQKAKDRLDILKQEWDGKLSIVPDETTPMGGGSGAGRAFSQRNYGMDKFEDLFTSRQILSLITLTKIVQDIDNFFPPDSLDNGLVTAVKTCLSLSIDKFADSNSGQVWWMAKGEKTVGSFSRQAISIIWDFSEIPFSDAPSRNYLEAIEWIIKVITNISNLSYPGIKGVTSQQNACEIQLSDDIAAAFITDPPYYDAVPYADLSDFFYVWLKRSLPKRITNSLFLENLSPKQDECILDEIKGMTKDYFKYTMEKVMMEGRRLLSPIGIGVVVFANKTTEGWEAQLQAMINGGWIIVGSWPIDTERQAKVNTINRAFLGSSIHLVCRPRENPDGTLREEIGDWREVLQELPGRIHDWMPRLAAEGVVGADAIFACLGPALEIFSRYSSVEKPNGEIVTLREYLEHVWAAVAKEALSMIFTGADTSGFEEDARLTAMWLWTLSTGGPVSSDGHEDEDEDDEGEGEGDEESGSKKKVKGYILEYDAARKIAQGLGADLSSLPGLVEVKGEKARLLPVGERSAYLLGKSGTVVQTKGRKKKDKQVTLGGTSEDGSDVPQEVVEIGEVPPGKTTLDRIHQSMILFQAGRGEALKSFLLENARDPKFWKLAQSLSALYPPGTEEKRWVDGVLARKKGLGL